MNQIVNIIISIKKNNYSIDYPISKDNIVEITIFSNIDCQLHIKLIAILKIEWNLVVCITIPFNYEIIDINLESISNNKIIQSNCDLYQIVSLSSNNIIKFRQIE